MKAHSYHVTKTILIFMYRKKTVSKLLAASKFEQQSGVECINWIIIYAKKTRNSIVMPNSEGLVLTERKNDHFSTVYANVLREIHCLYKGMGSPPVIYVTVTGY